MKFVMTARWAPDTQPHGCDADMEGWQILSIKGSPHVRIRRYANYVPPLKLSCARDAVGSGQYPGPVASLATNRWGQTVA
jgi:hypothetical protein